MAYVRACCDRRAATKKMCITTRAHLPAQLLSWNPFSAAWTAAERCVRSPGLPPARLGRVLKQIILNVVRPFSTAYAVHAANHATLQFGMALQHGVQGQQILPDQRPGTVALVPISSRSEELPDRNDKKARFWVTLEKIFSTPSSYLTEAHAS